MLQFKVKGFQFGDLGCGVCSGFCRGPSESWGHGFAGLFLVLYVKLLYAYVRLF